MRSSVFSPPWRARPAKLAAANKCLARSNKSRTRVVCEKEREVGWLAKQKRCRSGIVTDDDGVAYTIWHDGDCWLVPIGMDWNDETETYQWAR